ncbi:MAG: chemotaxis response regulator protein-glutamate methylesterase [Deferrisomatales bacterium]
MTEPPIRVLVVDDSAFVRRSIQRMLESDPGIQVVGTARDGLDALEKLESLRPDVVTLDLIMPGLDGVGFLRAMPGDRPVPVVVCTIASEGAPRMMEALEAGALDWIQKPTALALDDLYEIQPTLVAKVKAAAEARLDRVAPLLAPPPPPVAAAPPEARPGLDLVAVGASTGGPQALRHVLPRLPEGFPVPVAVVLHMPVGFTTLFAEHLDALCPLEVVEAAEGTEVRPGRILVARAGVHLKLRRRGGRVVAFLDGQPYDALHRPSVDVLLASAAQVFGDRALGVVLTGMGEDGLRGARALRERGGRVLAEDEASCVVYGMPRAVAEAGLADRVVPLNEMAEAICAEAQRTA